jgi:hypothetical protein
MAYLDEEWRKPGEPEPLPEGLWVPEKDWDGWKSRGAGLSYRDVWTRDRVVTRTELGQLAGLSGENRDVYLSVLGHDLGSVQRDSLFYGNWVERLKQALGEPTPSPPEVNAADKVFKAMEQLKFTSAEGGDFPFPGGPPEGESPRPLEKMLNWMLQQLAKVGKMILKITDALIAMIAKDGVDLSVGIGAFPPSFGVDVSTTLFRLQDNTVWDSLHRFLENAQAELSRAV